MNQTADCVYANVYSLSRFILIPSKKKKSIWQMSKSQLCAAVCSVFSLLRILMVTNKTKAVCCCLFHVTKSVLHFRLHVCESAPRNVRNYRRNRSKTEAWNFKQNEAIACCCHYKKAHYAMRIQITLFLQCSFNQMCVTVAPTIIHNTQYTMYVIQPNHLDKFSEKKNTHTHTFLLQKYVSI